MECSQANILCIPSQFLLVALVQLCGYYHPQFSCRVCFSETKFPYCVNRGVGGCVTEILSLILFWNDDMSGAHSQAQDLPAVLAGFFRQRVCSLVRRTLLRFQIQVTHFILFGLFNYLIEIKKQGAKLNQRKERLAFCLTVRHTAQLLTIKCYKPYVSCGFLLSLKLECANQSVGHI